MKRKVIIFSLSLLSFLLPASCKKNDDTDSSQNEQPTHGKVVFYLDNQKIVDAETDDINYISAAGSVGFVYSVNGETKFNGSITHVPDIGQTKAIADATTEECDTISRSCVLLESHGDYQTPEGLTFLGVLGKSGIVRRPSKEKVEAEGRCYVQLDGYQQREYSFKLEIDMVHFY